MVLRLLSSALLIGCGSMTPVAPTDAPSPSAEPDVLQGPPTGTQTWDFETPPDWNPYGEAWRIDIRESTVPGLPEDLFKALDAELAFEVLAEDPPLLTLRVAAIRAGSDPAEQHPCIPASLPQGVSVDDEGLVDLKLEPGEVSFGQPWLWDQVLIRATKDAELRTIEVHEVTGYVAATDLAFEAWGAGGCAELQPLGLPCKPCTRLAGDCVEVDLAGTGQYLDSFVVEPVSPADVAMNVECD